MKLRLKIAEVSSDVEQKLSGEIELIESYFGGRRSGRRGPGAADKQIVFGILERGGLVRTVPVEEMIAATLMEKVVTHTEQDCVYYTDQFRSYQSLKKFGKPLTACCSNRPLKEAPLWGKGWGEGSIGSKEEFDEPPQAPKSRRQLAQVLAVGDEEVSNGLFP